MAGARGEASNTSSGDKGSISTRPARLRVIRQDVQEVLKRPRRSRTKKPQPPSPPPPQPSPPRKKEKEKKDKEQKEKEKEQKGKEKVKKMGRKGKEEEEMEQKGNEKEKEKAKKETEQKGKEEEKAKAKKEMGQKVKEKAKAKKEMEQKGKEKAKKEMEQKEKVKVKVNKEMEQKGKEEKEKTEQKGKEKVKQEEEQVERARYSCAFQDEGEGSRDFAPPVLVWGKVRSHPWWPGQVFDAADASEVAMQHQKAGAPLVAYFWDRTFSWSDRSALLPFRANFTRLSTQSTMSGFVSALDAALLEVGRRVEAGLSCSCFGSSIAKQEVQNSGIRQGAYGAAVDASYMRDAFSAEAFLDYISALGNRPLVGADLLDLATAKAQLRAFNQTRGSRDLPEFVMFEGIEEFAEAIPHVKGQRMHSEDDVPSKVKKSRHAGSSSYRKEALPEVMDEDSGRGATDYTSTNRKGRKSKHMNSSVKKETRISKHSGEPDKVDVVESRTPANETVDDILSVSKSGRTLRSMRKKEDALEGLRMLGKDDSDETLRGKSKEATLLKGSKLIGRASSARNKSKITEGGHGLGDCSANDSASPGKRKSGHAENSMSRVPISEHGRKKKKLSELMAGTGRPNSAFDGKSRTRGKRSSHESTEKAEDPYLDLKDTAKTRKRKKLNTLGDLSSQSEPLSRKKSTEVGELMTKASGSSISHTPPSVETKGAASQAKSRRAKHRQVNAADKSPHPVKVNRDKKETFQESLSCDEMLWQLSVAACDLKQREKIASTSVNFFTDFRKNLSVSSSAVNEEIPEKAAQTESTPEQPIADHMQDDYWADILINVEEPLSSLRKKKDDSKKRTSKKVHQVKKLADNPSVTLENADEPRSEGKEDTEKGLELKADRKPIVANGSQLNARTKSAEEMEHSVLAGLVLHFSGPRAVPSRSDLIKIFSQYGPVSEAKAEITNNANSAQVIFKRRMDAEAAFAGAGKISALGPALVSFRLTDFPTVASGNEPLHGALKRG